MTNIKPEQPDISRRDFLTAAGATLLTPSLLSCQTGKNSAANPSKSDKMDEALEMMSTIGPLGNHCPMAVEALITLGHPENVQPFIESYKRRFSADYPAVVQQLTEKNWKEALGRNDRNTDWINYFNNEFKEKEWTEVLKTWADILASGLSAAAGHGIIRTCHAARSLAAKKTGLRIRELAEGLGYWAAYYQPLPQAQNTQAAKLTPQQAIERVPLLPVEKRVRGSIMAQLGALDSFQQFGDAIKLIDTAGKADHLLSAITETFTDVYIKNVSDRNNIALLHAVTAVSGVRSLAPYVSPQTTNKLLIYGWQTAAGLYSISGTGSRSINPPGQRRLKRKI